VNQVQSIVATAGVAVAGVVALIQGANDIALACLTGLLGLVAKSPLSK
jgi:hypothetical protein